MFEKSNTQIEAEKILKTDYSGIPNEQNENAMVAVSSFISHTIAPESIEKITTEAVRTIHRLFDFQFVAIALKDNDGLFRFKAQLGLTSESEKAYFAIAYSTTDLFDDSTFPSTAISDLTRFYMSENVPYKEDEVGTYDRPLLLTQKRMSADEMIEGDYIDVFIQDWKKEIIGYIELGTTRSKKFPDRNTIEWLELIATLIGLIISIKT